MSLPRPALLFLPCLLICPTSCGCGEKTRPSRHWGRFSSCARHVVLLPLSHVPAAAHSLVSSVGVCSHLGCEPSSPSVSERNASTPPSIGYRGPPLASSYTVLTEAVFFVFFLVRCLKVSLSRHQARSALGHSFSPEPTPAQHKKAKTRLLHIRVQNLDQGPK